MEYFENDTLECIGMDGEPNCVLFNGFTPKLTNGFVIIVEKELERGIIITRVKEMMEYCQTNGYVTPQDWLNKFKHYSDRKEPITYTEEEVKSLCSEAYLLGLSSLKSEIPDLEEMMELDNWFENNKKK